MRRRQMAYKSCDGITRRVWPITTFQTAEPAILHESRPNACYSRAFGVIPSPTGRFLLYQRASSILEAGSLSLVDTYFNREISFNWDPTVNGTPKDPKIRRLVGFFNDRCVVQLSRRLVWLRLDASTRSAVLFRKLKLHPDDLVFGLDSAGGRLLIHNLASYEISLWDMEIEGKPNHHRMVDIAEALCEKLECVSRSGDNIWLLSEQSAWMIRCSDLSLQRFPVEGRRSMTGGANTFRYYDEEFPGLDLTSRRLQTIRFIEHNIAVALVSGTLRNGEPAVRLFVLRLRDGIGAEIIDEYSLEPRDEWTTAYYVVCGRSALRIIRSANEMAHLQIRRPESLLVTAHMAALQSGRRFEMPANSPIAPVDGTQISYALPKATTMIPAAESGIAEPMETNQPKYRNRKRRRTQK